MTVSDFHNGICSVAKKDSVSHGVYVLGHGTPLANNPFPIHPLASSATEVIHSSWTTQPQYLLEEGPA